ncbi:MAG: DUF4412 domain-containing protein [Desulfobacula sp.]|uniref:DUF4412 domain-containing protein n=1 Tax=Desulfobacula sp. TaxID=2593537 RepID=UPI0025C1E0B1|nr:DUF4412 domain-containing protein [Desulfobacula sp.]MCD4720308.1 DUF4412 domain-containing protein [Desulfobacula sp.]
MTMATWIKYKPEIRLLGFILLVFLFIPQSSHALFGGKIDSFTADQVMISPKGKVMSTSKLYITPDAFRMDGIPGTGSHKGMEKQDLSIFGFTDKNAQYMFNHTKKLYYKIDQDDENMGIKDFKSAELVKVLGKEKVSGYKCVKKKVTTTTKIYGMTHTDTLIIWESDKFQMPLKTKGSTGHGMEIRNIKKGAPDKKYFKLPKGYKEVGNIMAAMGMDFGRMGEPETDETETTMTQTTPAAAKVPSKKETDSSKTAQEKTFKIPDIKGEDIEKTLKSFGDKLKSFSFGKD